MTVKITEYVNVRQRLSELGCNDPDGFALLPLHFETIDSIDKFCYPSEAATVKTIFRSQNLPLSEIFCSENRPPYVQNNAFEWLAPTIFVSASLIANHLEYLDSFIKNLAQYLTDYVRGHMGDKKVKLNVVLEDEKTGTCRRVEYNGSIEGLEKISEIVKSLNNDS